MAGNFKKYLFNPFEYIAGSKSLLIGLPGMLLTGLISYYTCVHFDGAIDMHLGPSGTLSQHLLEGIIDWISLSTMLYLSGIILSKTAIRAIDIFGTIALARWPMLIVSGLGIFIKEDRVNKHIEAKFLKTGEVIVLQSYELPVFISFIFITILLTILMVALFYKAYSISCNLKGSKAAWSFVIALLLAEVISKLILNQLQK